MKLSKEELINLHKAQEHITLQFKNNSRFGFDLEIDDFFLLIKNLNPQRYGLRAQAYFAEVLDYIPVSSKMDCGDFKNKEGEYSEFKCSFLTNVNEEINIKQIRLWQETRYYYIFTVDYRDYDNIIYKCYKLTKEQMLKECELMNASTCHMTKENVKNNEKVELAITVKLDGENYNRFEKDYLLKEFDIVKLSKDRLERINKEDKLKIQLEINQLNKQNEEIELILKSEKEQEELNDRIINKPLNFFELYKMKKNLNK